MKPTGRRVVPRRSPTRAVWPVPGRMRSLFAILEELIRACHLREPSFPPPDPCFVGRREGGWSRIERPKLDLDLGALVAGLEQGRSATRAEVAISPLSRLS